MRRIRTSSEQSEIPTSEDESKIFLCSYEPVPIYYYIYKNVLAFVVDALRH